MRDEPIPYLGSEQVRYEFSPTFGGSDTSSLRIAAAGLESGGSSVSKHQFSFLAIVTLLVPTVGIGRAKGDDIQWRESYAVAKKDARETGRPMLMEFGSPACLWCQKLETATLSATEVAKLINQRFIPVKIDATVDVDLASAVGVSSFPTLFVVAPDRTILNRHEGYFEVGDALDFLSEGLAKAPAPVKIARKSDETEKASKNASAIKLTSRGSDSSAVENALSPEKRARAQRLLNHAREDFDDGSFLASLERCRILVKEFSGQSEASEAQKLVDRIVSDPDRLRRASSDFGGNLVEIYRKLADEADKAGRESAAKEYREQATRAAALQSK
jgi:thioredoxin-like negative regulator of GroEL